MIRKLQKKKSHIGSVTSCGRVYIPSLHLYMDKCCGQEALSRARRGGANPRTKTELRGLGLVCTRTSWATRNAGPEWAFRAKPPFAILVSEKIRINGINSELKRCFIFQMS